MNKKNRSARLGCFLVAGLLLQMTQGSIIRAFASEASVDVPDAISTPLVGSDQNPRILSPLNDAELSGSVEVAANMQDADKIAFFIEERESDTQYYLGRGSEATAGIWSLTWDTTETPDGDYDLLVNAYVGSGMSAGERVLIHVNNIDETDVQDPSTDPVVDPGFPLISHPLDNSNLEGEVEIQASASATAVHFFTLDKDNKVIFVGHGEKLESGEWAYVWKTNKLPNGQYGLYMVAYDALGTKTQSDPINITLQNTNIITNTDPQVQITEPEGEILAQSTPVPVRIADDASASVDAASISAIPVLENIEISDVTIELRQSTDGSQQGYIHFVGQAPADCSLALHIFSDPIVATTRTDENGDWVYTLDRSLEQGKHEMYVTVSDSNKNVVGRSGILEFFVESAVAAQDLQTDNIVNVASSNRSLLQTYMLIAVALVVGVILAFAILQKTSKKNQNKNAAN